MSLPKLLMLATAILFTFLGIAILFKKEKQPLAITPISQNPIEINLEPNPVKPGQQGSGAATKSSPLIPVVSKEYSLEKKIEIDQKKFANDEKTESEMPSIDLVERFFNKDDNKFPIVETITYRSRVPWQKGRPAWLSDYANHYSTSRHFIARSLNGKTDYLKQDVAEGDRFNVFRKDKNMSFYLLVDVSLSQMRFYYIDLDTKQRVLVKCYRVGLGRNDINKPSGLLTPFGKYSLGNKIAIYKPKIMDYHNGQKVEMLKVFGTRWIPFEKEISGTTAPAKGFGIHGVPWMLNGKGELEEDRDSIGKRLGDGCIRLLTADVEELFAIIITKPAIIEIVKDFKSAHLPGIEKQL
jgi:hypothetical protein